MKIYYKLIKSESEAKFITSRLYSKGFKWKPYKPSISVLVKNYLIATEEKNPEVSPWCDSNESNSEFKNKMKKLTIYYGSFKTLKELKEGMSDYFFTSKIEFIELENRTNLKIG
jgi:hypothetical protein